MRVHNEKERWGESLPRKKDEVRVDHEKKSVGVRVHHKKKSDRVTVDHEKKAMG